MSRSTKPRRPDRLLEEHNAEAPTPLPPIKLRRVSGEPLASSRARTRGTQGIRSSKLEDELIDWITRGKTLADWCRLPGHPTPQAVNLWRTKDPEFAKRFGEARDAGFDAIAEDCVKIADDGSNDTYLDEDGNTVTNTDVVARSKLRVETRLKLLAKWDPRRYGDKTEIGVAQGVSLVVATNVPRPSDSE